MRNFLIVFSGQVFSLFGFGAVQVGHVYALLFVRALGSTFHWPAMQASTTLMVPERHLARVAGIGQALRGVAGGLLLGIWGGFRRRIVTVLLGIAFLGTALGSIGALPEGGFSGLVAAVFAAGVLAPMVVGSFQAIQQAVVPPEIQGRVMAIARSGMDLMSPVGLAVAGPVADAVGVRHWYLLTGAVMVVMAAAAFLLRSLMTIEEGQSPGGSA